MPNRLLIEILKKGFSLVLHLDRRSRTFIPEEVKNILLLNTTAMGDTLLSTPAIRALRTSFPWAHISSLASPVAKEILINNPNIDRIIDYPGRVNLPFLFRLPAILRNLRKEKADISIVLDSNDPEAGPLSYLSGAQVRIGWQESRLSFLFTIPVRKRIEGLHVVDIKLKALEAIGVRSDIRRPEIFLTRKEETAADELLRREGLSGDRLFGLHPFGAKRNRWWPEEYAVALSDRLSEKYSIRAVLFGGPKEVPFAQRIAGAVNRKPFIAAGKISIREAASLMKRCDFVVTPDSGPMHLAQAVGTPTVALFGPADPNFTGPTGEKNVVIRKEMGCSPCKDYDCPHSSCMKDITVDDVLNSVREMGEKGWIRLEPSVK